MSSYPNRCQHIKINGTQCGSPALRRNKFCFFHKKWHEQRIVLNAKQARRARAIELPVLEDANSVQVALMQIMRMTMSGELDTKKAGLLLYGLQTASANLRHTNFDPFLHEVVLDPRQAADSLLGETDVWCDEDFEEEEEDEAEEVELNAEAEEGVGREVRAEAEELGTGLEAQAEEEDASNSVDEDKAQSVPRRVGGPRRVAVPPCRVNTTATRTGHPRKKTPLAVNDVIPPCRVNTIATRVGQPRPG